MEKLLCPYMKCDLLTEFNPALFLVEPVIGNRLWPILSRKRNPMMSQELV